MCFKDSMHHRKPRSLGGVTSARNTVWMTRKRHQAWHTLFDNWGVQRIEDEMNQMIDPDYEVIIRRKE